MTIRNNWCQDCEVASHGEMCTICGGALTEPPRRSAAPPSMRVLPDLEDFLPAGLLTADILSIVREQVRATQAFAEEALGRNGGGDWRDMATATAGHWDPPSGGRTPTRPEVLDKLPREILHDRSIGFFQVVVEIAGVAHRGISGELGPLPQILHDNPTRLSVTAPLWIPQTRPQRTGREAWTDLENIPDPPFVAVLERGDGISFFTKAHAAELLGAQAVIVINDKREPWPYIMKDSRTTAQKETQGKVSIPTVMVTQAVGTQLLRKYNMDNPTDCSLSISHDPHDHATCVICRDALQLGQSTLTLTNYCGHVFHESCALQWLENHNTCPYCRTSLPTDEAGREAERLRLMTNATAHETYVDGFYL